MDIEASKATLESFSKYHEGFNTKLAEAKAAAEAEGADDQVKERYQSLVQRGELYTSTASALQYLSEMQEGDGTEKLKALEAEKQALNEKIAQLSGSFDEERAKFESEREAFTKSKEEHEASHKAILGTLKATLESRLAALPEHVQKAVKAVGDDPLAQQAQLKILEESGVVGAEPPRSSQSTAGGSNPHKGPATTWNEMEKNEERRSKS